MGSSNDRGSCMYVITLISVVGWISNSKAATVYNNHTYNNVFQRGLSFRGNDRISKDFHIPESHEQRAFRNSKCKLFFVYIMA